MIVDYITDLIGDVPQSLEVVVYFFSLLLVFFGLGCVISLINTIFHKFF